MKLRALFAALLLFLLLSPPVRADHVKGHFLTLLKGDAHLYYKQCAPGQEEAAAKHEKQRVDVQLAVPDVIVHHCGQFIGLPNDPQLGQESWLAAGNIPPAWTVTTGNSNIWIFVLDTGIDTAHPDLQGRLLVNLFRNFYNLSNDLTRDPNGHGTAVAGIFATGNNGQGIAGVAWGCPIVSYVVADANANSTTGTIYGAMTAAADTAAANGKRAVINCSYSPAGTDKGAFLSTIAGAANYAEGKGCQVVIPAGNDGAVATTFVVDDHTLVAASVNAQGQHSAFSTSGGYVDCAADGEGVLTLNRGGGYGYWSGTSFSSPEVAGEMALLLSANPTMTVKQCRDKLLASCKNVMGYDIVLGWGVIDAGKALAGGVTPPPPPTPTYTANGTLYDQRLPTKEAYAWIGSFSPGQVVSVSFLNGAAKPVLAVYAPGQQAPVAQTSYTGPSSWSVPSTLSLTVPVAVANGVLSLSNPTVSSGSFGFTLSSPVALVAARPPLLALGTYGISHMPSAHIFTLTYTLVNLGTLAANNVTSQVFNWTNFVNTPLCPVHTLSTGTLLGGGSWRDTVAVPDRDANGAVKSIQLHFRGSSLGVDVTGTGVILTPP